MMGQDYFWTWIEIWIGPQSMSIQSRIGLTEQGLRGKEEPMNSCPSAQDLKIDKTGSVYMVFP
jgi:hypothetical protein